MGPEKRNATSNGQSRDHRIATAIAAITNREDWVAPPEQTIPHPTYAPAALSLGIAFVFFGIVTSYLFCWAGGVVMALALKSWIGGMADGE